MACRVAPLDPPYAKSVQKMLDRLMVPSSVAGDPVYHAISTREPTKFFRTWVRHPELTQAFQSVREWMHADSQIGALFRELIALRTCVKCGAKEEWGLRVAIYGERVGLRLDQIEATVHGCPTSPCWSPREAAVVALVDELHDTAKVSDELWSRLEAQWSPTDLLELTFVVGWYHLLSFVANAVQMEGETWAVPYPSSPATGTTPGD